MSVVVYVEDEIADERRDLRLRLSADVAVNMRVL